MSSHLMKMPTEPDLSAKVPSASDRLNVRNILYTSWTLFNTSEAATSYQACFPFCFSTVMIGFAQFQHAHMK